MSKSDYDLNSSGGLMPVSSVSHLANSILLFVRIATGHTMLEESQLCTLYIVTRCDFLAAPVAFPCDARIQCDVRDGS